MNIVKVSIEVKIPLHREAMTNRYWTGYFNCVPTLEKLIEVVRADLGRHHTKNILSVLQAAKSAEVAQNSTRLVISVTMAGVQIGIIEYENITVFSLEDADCDWNLLVRNY